MAFRFSKKFGISTTDDLSGEPYYVDIAEENVTAEPPVVHEMANKLKDELQLAVCLPGKIRLTLSNNDKKIARYEMWAAQFGKIEMLNGALFGKKLTSKILLDSAMPLSSPSYIAAAQCSSSTERSAVALLVWILAIGILFFFASWDAVITILWDTVLVKRIIRSGFPIFFFTEPCSFGNTLALHP